MKFVHAQTKCRIKIGAGSGTSGHVIRTLYHDNAPRADFNLRSLIPEITFREGGKEMSVPKPYVRDSCLTGVARSLLINCEVV